ncbi:MULTISPECIES: hypothetical protein [unclassified Streptomyces]|uniref:hypothetical protein n=1 Tax=unclassified Streptomyces TaxID=2593676 RepID=UPI0015A1E0E6|nr:MULTISPECIES: hypothetical protein [unclassified Streptomyces]
MTGGDTHASSESGTFPANGTLPESGAFPGEGRFQDRETFNGIRRGGRTALTDAGETVALPRPPAQRTAPRGVPRPADFRRAPARDEERTTVLPPVAEAERTAVLPAATGRGHSPAPHPAAAGRTPAPAGARGPWTSTGTLRDPWDESATTASDSMSAPAAGATAARTGDATHDPHEVTVQLDAVQLGDVQLSPAAGAARGADADGPVFVDESGRRSRRFRRIGMLVAVACAVYAVVIVATLMSGSSDAPWLPVPGQNEQAPAGRVGISPAPADSARPSATGTGTGTGSAAPDDTVAPSDGSTAVPGATAQVPDSGEDVDVVDQGGSPDARPSADQTTKGTGGKDSSSPRSTPSTPENSTETAPSGPATETADPSEPAASGGGLGGALTHRPVAEGPQAPAPVAAEPVSAGSSNLPSPEHNL